MTRSVLARVAGVFAIGFIGLATMRTAFADTAVCTGDASVVFYIDNPPTSTCSSVPAWFGANTRYFALQK